MNTFESVLVGIVIALVSGFIGKALGSRSKITEGLCDERRKSCQKLLIEKIDHLSKLIDNLHKLIENTPRNI
jgi:hypothetical protein